MVWSVDRCPGAVIVAAGGTLLRLMPSDVAFSGENGKANRLASEKKDAFARHIVACNSARLPGERIRFLLDGRTVGWLDPRLADAMAGRDGVRQAGGGLTLADPAALPALARGLSEQGYFRWRNEEFDVRETPESAVLATIDRGALPVFGVQAVGVHVNGLVRRDDGLHLWVARRASDKHLDPGKLDHVVAGGVPAGLTARATLVKEAGEEAAIPPALAERAVRVGRIAYAMDRPEGLRRDVLHCYDLELPQDFTPRPVDGEVAGFELWPIERALAAVRDTDDFKFNVNLVLIDLFLRLGMIADDGSLRRGLGS